MFDHLPHHIREKIFIRVRYLDLFETARVSKRWWTLTMASFERVIRAKDDFLLNQVDFCNEVMPKGEPWQWWMLMEFTKSKKLYLDKGDFGQLINGVEGELEGEEVRALMNEGKRKLIQYFKDKEINVRNLRIDGVFPDLPPNLNQLFPDLISLELNYVEFEEGAAVVLPAKLEVVKMFWVKFSSKTKLTSILTDSSKLKVLHLTAFRSDVFLDGLNCQNLTSLSLDNTCLWAEDGSERNRMLRNIMNQNKGLKSVSLIAASITKEWLKIFPSHIVKLQLHWPDLSLDLIRLFGKNVLYERMTLCYIFEDWKSVTEFRTWEMRWNKDLQEEDEDNAGFYLLNYICKPPANIEEIDVHLKEGTIALKDVILRKNEGLELNTLRFGLDNFPYAVPQTVRNLSVGSPYYSETTLEFDDSSVLETFTLDPPDFSTINLDVMSNMTNLRKLVLSKCNSHCLDGLLVSCASLAELTLDHAGFSVFADMDSDIQSTSVERLTVIGGGDHCEDIVKHLPSLRTLILEKHAFWTISELDLKAIESLQYFQAVVKRIHKVAVHFSSLQFPYMFCARGHNYDYYAVSKGIELINEISVSLSIRSKNILVKGKSSFLFETYLGVENVSFAYSKNIATRFLRNSLVCKTIDDFIAKH